MVSHIILLSGLFLALYSQAVYATIGDFCKHSGFPTAYKGICQKTSSCTKGFTTTGDCPDDPTNVKCCFDTYKCSLDNFSGTCRDKSVANSCDGGKGFTAGLCPGSNDVQCCMSRDDIDGLVDFLKRTYNLAVQYGKGKPNQLVIEWLRHKKYNGLTSGWKVLIGDVDDDWIDFANNHGLYMFDTFADPQYCGQAVETDHWGATMNAILLKPTPSYPNTNRGDFGGWAGDLATFYGEWQGSRFLKKDDGYQYATKNLGSPTISSTFKLLDFLEDADAFNIVAMLRADASLTIYNAVARYYKPGGPYKTRFTTFLNNRFSGGDAVKAKAIIKKGLTQDGDAALETLRKLAVQKGAGVLEFPPSLPVDTPDILDEGQLNRFVDGVYDVLKMLAKDSGISCSV